MSDTSSFHPDEEIELVKRAKEGDVSAFDALCRIHSARLGTFLTRMVMNDDVGREIAQEVLLTAWVKIRDLKQEAYFQTWLYRIAINTALNRLQHDRHFRWLSWEEHEHLNITRDEYINITSLENQVAEAEMVRLALEYVSPMYRACLLLQVVADLPQRRIAEIVGIDVKNVSTNVRRAMDQFRKAYQLLESELDISMKRRSGQ